MGRHSGSLLPEGMLESTRRDCLTVPALNPLASNSFCRSRINAGRMILVSCAGSA
jgi:hypothetical protein